MVEAKIKWPSGFNLTAAGVAILAVNLTSRHVDELHNDWLIWATGWIGSILVIVGVGKMMFLDDA